MTDALFAEDDDANTPLTPQEREGLIPSYITTRGELNAAEHANISEAVLWLSRRRKFDLLDVEFLKALHKRMLGKVWKWAGQFRQSERNIGIDHHRIEMELHQLVDDVRYWVEHHSYPPDEIAVRFAHRLVSIHPFANGNGRHSRLAADLLIQQLGGALFSWGRASLVEPGETRRRYVQALKAADGHDIAPLLEFSRT